MTTLNLDIAVKLDIVARAGSTLALRITAEEDDGTAIDLRNFQFALQVKNNERSQDPILEFTTANGGIVGYNGYLTINGDGDYMQIQPRDYVYDLEAISPDGEKKTWLYGMFTINADVTRTVDAGA